MILHDTVRNIHHFPAVKLEDINNFLHEAIDIAGIPCQDKSGITKVLQFNFTDIFGFPVTDQTIRQ